MYIYIYIHVYVYVCMCHGGYSRTSFTRQFLSTFTTNADRRLYRYTEWKGRWDAICRQRAAWRQFKGWDGEGRDGFARELRGERRGGWQSVLRPVDAATMPAAAAAAASTTSTEQHRIRVIRRDSGCCGVANSVEGEQPGRVRPAWWGLTRSRSVSVPRSRGDVISGGSRAVFFLSRSFSFSLARVTSSPSSFLFLIRQLGFPYALFLYRYHFCVTIANSKKFLFLLLVFFVFFILSPYVSMLIFCLMVSCSRTK